MLFLDAGLAKYGRFPKNLRTCSLATGGRNNMFLWKVGQKTLPPTLEL